MSKIGNISDWKYILLDTSFIIDYLSNPDKLDNNPTKRENCVLAKQIMDLLSLKKDGDRPVFYVSAITIGELRRLETQSITKKIISCFSSGDVTILPYGKSEAEILNKTVFDWKKEKQPNVTLKQLEEDCQKNGCSNFRAWINDDMKILSCVKSLHDKRRLDVILTSDERTFLPIATFMELPCMVLKTGNFPKDLFGELK